MTPMIRRLNEELLDIDEGTSHMEADGTLWCVEYKRLRKRRRIIKKCIRKLEKLEVHKK